MFGYFKKKRQERNIKLARKEKRKLTKKTTFAKMLIPRLLICILVALILSGYYANYVRDSLLEPHLSNPGLESYYSKFTEALLSYENYQDYSSRNQTLKLDYSNGYEQWINSFGNIKTVMSLMNNWKTGEDYWAVYDMDTGKAISDANKDQLYVMAVYLDEANEQRPFFYELAEEQKDIFEKYLEENTMFGHNLLIMSAYIKDNTIYIESYKESENGELLKTDVSNMTGAHHIVLDNVYVGDKKDNIFESPYISYGKDCGYDVAFRGVWRSYGSNPDEEIVEKSYNSLKELREEYGEEYGLAEGERADSSLFKETILREGICNTRDGHCYGVVWAKTTIIDKQMYLLEVIGCAAIIVALFTALALLLTSRAYRNYKIAHDIYEYRKSLTDAMAHDLKSPLASISGYAENLLSGGHPEKSSYYAQQIMERTAYMNELIEKLLELSKTDIMLIDSKENINIRPAAEKLFADYEEQMKTRSLKYEISGELAAKGDEITLNTALKNLIENAVKYSDDNSIIKLELMNDKIKVINACKGAEKLDTTKLTEAYVMGDAARSGAKGNGLGLAIVKNICDAHGYVFNITCEQNAFIAEISL